MRSKTSVPDEEPSLWTTFVEASLRGIGVHRLDLVGLIILGMAVGWLFFSAAREGGDPGPPSALLLGAAVTWVVARLAASVRRSMVALTVAAAASVLALSALGAGDDRRFPSGPLGYANASAAFFVQAALAALMLLAAWRRPWARCLALTWAVGFAILPFITGSVAAAGLVIVLPALSLAVWMAWGARAAVGLSAVLFLGVLVVTMVLAAVPWSDSRSGNLAGVWVGAGRGTLWHEALVIMGSHPATGVGPGRYRVASSTAQDDPDAAAAHHGFLQEGAETGVPGMVLLVVVFLWVYARLWAAPSGAASGVLAAVAVTSLGIHACVDYVLHFPAVVLTTAALAGAGMGRRVEGSVVTEGMLVDSDPPGEHLFGVLVTFQRPRELALALARLAEQDRPLDRLVVVDNAPTEATQALVEYRRDGAVEVEYLPMAENLGFAGGVAVGMTRVLELAGDGDWIVVLDDDDPPDSPTAFADLERFALAMRQVDPRTAAVGLVGARFDWKRGRMARVPDEELKGPVPVDFIGGGHLPLYLVGAIRRVGPFSREIFFGLSEVEHGLRLRRAGYSIYAHGSLWRERRTRSGRLGLDPRPSRRLSEPTWRRYYSLRNAIYILRSFGHPGTALRVTFVQGLAKPLANMPLAPRAAWRHLLLNRRACVDAWRSRMGRTLEPDIPR